MFSFLSSFPATLPLLGCPSKAESATFYPTNLGPGYQPAPVRLLTGFAPLFSLVTILLTLLLSLILLRRLHQPQESFTAPRSRFIPDVIYASLHSDSCET